MTLWLTVGSLAAFIGASVFFFLQGKKLGAKGEKAKWLELTNEGREARADRMVEVNKRAKDREAEVRASSDRPVNPSADVLDMSTFKTPSRSDRD